MEIIEAIKIRHSVRSYTDQKITGEVFTELKKEIDQCNLESGLHIELYTDEPKAFDSFMAHYGKLINVKNYIAIMGNKKKNLNESCGYYGERVVLKATQLGLQTCWVAQTFSRRKSVCEVQAGEKIYCVIAIGYGESMGKEHKSKPLEVLCSSEAKMPEWFLKGMEAAILAPTAMNQQKFHFTLKDGKVLATAGKGFYTDMDLGIAKYHFEKGSGYHF